MYTPVDENAAAGDGIGGERTAETGDGALRTEGNINMINLAELAGLNHLTELVDGGVEAVDNADVENLAGFVLSLLHEERVGVCSCGRLLAKHVLAGSERVAGNDGVHLVGGADGNSDDFGIVDDLVIVLDSDTAAVLFNAFFSLPEKDIAEILDFDLFVLEVVRDVGVVGDSAAADNSYFHFSHDR